MGVVERLVELEHYVVDQLAALRLSRHIGVVRMVRPQKRAVAAEGAGQQERAVRLGEGRRLVRENLMVNAGELGTLLVRSVESLKSLLVLKYSHTYSYDFAAFPAESFATELKIERQK